MGSHGFPIFEWVSHGRPMQSSAFQTLLNLKERGNGIFDDLFNSFAQFSECPLLDISTLENWVCFLRSSRNKYQTKYDTEKYLIWREIYFGSGQFFLIKQHFIEKL
jgi:hypothetical protein